MPRYRIISSEQVETTVELEAANEDAALEAWEQGEGELIDTDIFQPEIERVIEIG